jgi:glutamyl/glutaminyl-tRNA synthetase
VAELEADRAADLAAGRPVRYSGRCRALSRDVVERRIAAGAGRSGGGDDAELLPIEELARRFSLDRVGRSAGVFDEEKLAWANRHYLKMADPARIAELAVPYFRDAGVTLAPDEEGMAFLASAMAMATASVDRLNQIPARLAFLFDFSPERALQDAAVRDELSGEDARAVVQALAEALAGTRLADRDAFRALANQVKARTGQKAKALFHPIRLALTGRSDGPELDLAVPVIDRGAALPASAGIPRVLSNGERAAAFARALAG